MFNWIVAVVVIIWIYVLFVLKRTKLDFWFFLVGAAGLFTISIITLQPILLSPVQKLVTAVAGVFGRMTGMYTAFLDKGIVFISHGKTNVSMYVDFECSGIIESFALIALVVFFPAYQFYEKVVVSIVGTITIFFANVFRIFIICFCLYFWGEEAFFYAHTIVGRFFFYACTIALYFYVFTKSQIIRQKVGAFSYDDN